MGIIKFIKLPQENNAKKRFFTIASFFMFVCFYLLVLNPYHIIYLEQSQLFLFSQEYFKSFMGEPGGLAAYLGSFFTQFFINKYSGTLILLAAAFCIFYLSDYIFRRFYIDGLLFSFLPVLIFLALLSDYIYSFGSTFGLIIALWFCTIFLSLQSNKVRYLFGICGWIVLYYVAGGWSIIAAFICSLYLIFISQANKRIWLAAVILLAVALVPFISMNLLYFVTSYDAWLAQVFYTTNKISRYLLIVLFAYYPAIILIFSLYRLKRKTEQLNLAWSVRNISLAIFIFFSCVWYIFRYSYDKRTEAIFRVDYYVQHEKWDKVLKQSSKYPGTNRLMIYFTNLALYKTGRMGDKLFQYSHTGKDDLWLEWPGGKLSLFFGAEVFYDLGYFNESFRRAYDAMILNGKNPRSLKYLAKISIINSKNELAGKYLNVLSQTLFYSSWAKSYKAMLRDPDLMMKNAEIAEKRNLLLEKDFLVDPNHPDKLLFQLISFKPANRMAYEYFMSALLLDKNISAFTDYCRILKNYGFREIPVHYEEALLAYMDQTRKNVIPEGLKIRNSTILRFKSYYSDFSTARTAYQGNPQMIAEKLYDKYGTTYWYYLTLLNNNIKMK